MNIPKKNKKSKNSGMTLVELMVVIMVIAILSSISLASLLNQQEKAKSTEASAKISTILKQGYTDFQGKVNEDSAINSALLGCSEANGSGKFEYMPYKAGAGAVPIPNTTAGNDLVPENILIIGADPSNAAETDDGLIRVSEQSPLTDGKIFGCINLMSGKVDIDNTFKDSVDINVNGSGTTTTVAGLNCS